MKRSYIIHPYLFAIFPSLFIFANNLGHLYFYQILLPTFVILIITLLSILLLKMVLNDNIKTGIIISVALILFFSYGHVFEAIEAWQIFKYGRNDIHIHRYLLLSCITIIAIPVYFLNNKAENLHDINNAVNVAAFDNNPFPHFILRNYAGFS